jgi:uncharacterized membrane-anchored protein
MNETAAIRLVWLAGAIHAGIVVANVPLFRRLEIRENVKSMPRFERQIFLVHWLYIVLVVGMFSAACLLFARDLAGASALGRFLSGFMGGFWLLRIFLQIFYYDGEVRRKNRALDALYVVSLCVLVAIFGFVAIRPL